MEYFVFKLNLEPSVLKTYHYNDHKNHVVGTVIPDSLKKIFKKSRELQGEKVKFLDEIDLNRVRESTYYLDMLNSNENMINMYREVVENFNEGKGITYSPEYLDQRDELNKSIESVISNFPFLLGSYDLKDSVFPIETFSKIQMAVTYIRKAKKIESYLKNFPDKLLTSYFIYDKSTEFIYISTEDKTAEEAKNYIELLEEKINKFSSISNIGRVSINPIYEEFTLEGLYSEITVELVYPNGNPSRDRSKAIQEANAAREKRIFEASKDAKIDAHKLNDYFISDAKRGYVDRITSKGKNIIKGFIKIVTLQED